MTDQSPQPPQEPTTPAAPPPSYAAPPPPPPPPVSGGAGSGDLTDNDKLMALLSWVIAPLVGIIVLLTDGGKRPFQRWHAVNSIVTSIALWVVFTVIGCICATFTFGLGTFVIFLVYLPLIYYAIQAYQGKTPSIPIITDFCRNQGWTTQA